MIDSHTGGEPTRVVIEGGPDLGEGPLAERAARLSEDHKGFWQDLVREPRGQTAMVGALLTKPVDPGCAAGVIFFDADAVIGMCGHGTIGLAVTLAHLGRIGPGLHRIETPVGIVEVRLESANRVTVTNVESRRLFKDITVDVPGIGPVTGDIAYGGNWFFLSDTPLLPIARGNIPGLTEIAKSVRDAIGAAALTGPQGQRIDHVVLLEYPENTDISARSFTLCPDDSYDRSPCGTGCSARIACLAADGRLAPGAQIVQESVTGSRFSLSYDPGTNGGVVPHITGEAWLLAETNMIFDATDPCLFRLAG